jgi:hypothetical protein
LESINPQLFYTKFSIRRSAAPQILPHRRFASVAPVAADLRSVLHIHIRSADGIGSPPCKVYRDHVNAGSTIFTISSPQHPRG